MAIRAGIIRLHVFTYPPKCVGIWEITFFSFNRIFIEVVYAQCMKYEELNSAHKKIIQKNRMQQTQSTGNDWFCNCFDCDFRTRSRRDCPSPTFPNSSLVTQSKLLLDGWVPSVRSTSNNVLLSFRKYNINSRTAFYCMILGHFLMMLHVNFICSKNIQWNYNTWAFHIECINNYLIISINVSIKDHSYMELHIIKVLTNTCSGEERRTFKYYVLL